MPDTAAFCPGCGRAMGPAQHAQGTVSALPENVAGALAYCTFIPAVVFLLLEPYCKNRFVRFHSVQCIGVCLAGLVIGVLLRVVDFVLFVIPVLGHLLVWLLSMVVTLAFLAVWVVLIVKALQGEMIKVPVVGDFAEQQANTV